MQTQIKRQQEIVKIAMTKAVFIPAEEATMKIEKLKAAMKLVERELLQLRHKKSIEILKHAQRVSWTSLMRQLEEDLLHTSERWY